jgi:hypothetical protein
MKSWKRRGFILLVKIPARTRLRFTPAKALKESVLGVAASAAKKKPAAKPKAVATRIDDLNSCARAAYGSALITA